MNSAWNRRRLLTRHRDLAGQFPEHLTGLAQQAEQLRARQDHHLTPARQVGRDGRGVAGLASGELPDQRVPSNPLLA